MISLIYDYNFAMIADKTIDRPSSVSPSEWLEMWDKIATIMGEKNDKRELRRHSDHVEKESEAEMWATNDEGQ
jgi:hypothetical protein